MSVFMNATHTSRLISLFELQETCIHPPSTAQNVLGISVQVKMFVLSLLYGKRILVERRTFYECLKRHRVQLRHSDNNTLLARGQEPSGTTKLHRNHCIDLQMAS